MKNIKKKVFFIAIFVLSLLLFPVTNTSNNAVAAGNNEILKHFFIVSDGETVTDDFISTVVDEETRKSTTYICVNDTVTIGLKPFEYKYALIEDDEDINNNFYQKITPIEILKSSEEYQTFLTSEETYPSLTFKYDNKTYYFATETKTIKPPPDIGEEYTKTFLRIYDVKPISQYSTPLISTENTNAIRYFEDDNAIRIEIVESYTLSNFSQIETAINIPTLNWSTTPQDNKLVFIKNPVRFSNNEEPVVNFDTFKNLNPSTMKYDYEESLNWLQKEQSFTKVSLTFLTNTYTFSESSPLYFKINFNGFVYDYKLYAKDGNLYVTYIDEIRYNNAIKAEQTAKDDFERQEALKAKNKSIFQLATSSDLSKIVNFSQQFSMTFTYRGRYSFEVYDSTYLYGIKNANYFSTSFYIKDDSASIEEYIETSKNNADFMQLFEAVNPNATPAKIAELYENFYDAYTKDSSNREFVEELNKTMRVNIAININEFKNAFNIKYPQVSEDDLESLYYSFYDEFISDTKNNKDTINRIEDLATSKSKRVYIDTAKKFPVFKEAFDLANPDYTDEKIANLYYDFYNLFLTDEQYTSLENYQDIVNAIDYKTKTNLLYNNVYILSQSIDDNGNPLEYIVNNATLNHSVKTTIKNFSNFDIEGFELEDVVSKVDVTYTEFGNSNNLPTTTSHPVAEIKEFMANNEDYFLTFHADGYYQVRVYSSDNSKTVEYNFTIVKQTKVNYTIDGITYTATQMFHTDTRNYSKFINNKDPLTMAIGIDTINSTKETALNITYENKYYITYGMQKVDIGFSLNEDGTVLYISCRGVGDLTVTVEVNGTKTVHNLNSEKGNGTIATGEYGTYKVTMKDNMGTYGANSYKFSKKMNTSALILVVLSSIIAAAIALFVITARGKIKTR